MTRDRRAKRRSPEVDEEEFILFLHGLPPTARWQELKDLAKEYNTVHYRCSTTIEPKHEIGFILFAGRKNARYAFDQFSHRGWRGQSIVVTLNGPIDRSGAVQRLGDGLGLVDGPVRSPGSHRSHGQIDWKDVNSAIASWMQHHPPIPHLAATSHVPPSTPTYITAGPGPHYGLPTTQVEVPVPYDRRSSVPSSQTSSRSVQDGLPTSLYYSSRHVVPVSTTYPSPGPAFIQHTESHPNSLRSHLSYSGPSRHVPSAHSAAVAASTTFRKAPDRSICVRGLPSDCTQAKAVSMFESFGDVELSSVRVQVQVRQKGRRNIMTAYATFKDHKGAAKAVNELGGRRTTDGFLSVCFDGQAEDGRTYGGAKGAGGSRRVTPVPPTTTPTQTTSTRPRYREEVRDGQRKEEKRGGEERRPQRTTTRGPLVVDGAKGSLRRRRDVRSEIERGGSQNGSDSDASDVQREARRRGSSGSGESGSSGEERERSSDEFSHNGNARDHGTRVAARPKKG